MTAVDLAPAPDSLHWGLEAPVTGAQEGPCAFPLEGWVVGIERPVERIDVIDPDGEAIAVPVSLERVDICEAQPDVAWSLVSGFSCEIGVAHLPESFALKLVAIFEDGSTVELGTVTGRRAPHATPPRVMVTQMRSFVFDDVVVWSLEESPVRYPSPMYSVPLRGWAVGLSCPVERIEVSAQRGDMMTAPVEGVRESTAQRLADIEWAGRSGFSLEVGAARLARRFNMTVSAVLADGSRLTLAEIEGRRASLPNLKTARMRPALVTTIGRTGSSWLNWVLGCHPDLFAYRPFEYEPRVTDYFAAIFEALAEPSSYLQAVRGDVYGSDWWLGRDYQFPHHAYDPEFERWLGTDHVEGLAGFLLGRIDLFYERMAQLEGKADASMFVEKLLPVSPVQDLLWETHPGMREIFLLRDPRDLASSVIAFNQRRGFAAFGRESVDTDEEFVRGPLQRDVELLARAWERRGERAHLVRYEDLIEQPEPTLAAVFGYLEVDASSEAIAGVLEAAAGQDPQARSDHQTAGSAKASIGRWQRDLPAALQEASDEALGPFLDQFGYGR